MANLKCSFWKRLNLGPLCWLYCVYNHYSLIFQPRFKYHEHGRFFFFFFFHKCTLHMDSIIQNIFTNIQSNHMVILAICDNMVWLVWPNIWRQIFEPCDASIIGFLWMFVKLISLGVTYSLYNFPKENIFDNNMSTKI
jgi:hypothetical protein